jgi:hypothetical protein
MFEGTEENYQRPVRIFCIQTQIIIQHLQNEVRTDIHDETPCNLTGNNITENSDISIFWVLRRLTSLPSRWTYQVPPKHWYLSIKIFGIAFQKAVIFITTG